MNSTPSMGSISTRSRAMMLPSSSPLAAPCGANLRRRYWLHAPGAALDHHLPGPDQAQRLVDLLELVGGAGAVALALRHLHVGVVDMVVEPGLVDLAALGLDFHGAPIMTA